jgi:hypothetical protein
MFYMCFDVLNLSCLYLRNLCAPGPSRTVGLSDWGPVRTVVLIMRCAGSSPLYPISNFSSDQRPAPSYTPLCQW